MKSAETRTVRSQAEFDQAIKEKVAVVLVDSPKAVRIVIDASGDSAIEVQGESTIQRVWGSATIQRVWDSATIQSVWGSATIQRVWGSATIQSVWGSATIQSVGGSATIQSVWGSATAHLHGSSKAPKIGPYATVYVHSARATFDPAGRIVDLTELNLIDPKTWCEFNGVDVTEVEDGTTTVILYKAVDADLVAGHSYIPTTYTIGEVVTASDWRPTTDCGHGLHLCAEPAATLAYHDEAVVRFLACEVDLADLIPLEDKVKVRTLRVLHEVDLGGKPVAA